MPAYKKIGEGNRQYSFHGFSFDNSENGPHNNLLPMGSLPPWLQRKYPFPRVAGDTEEISPAAAQTNLIRFFDPPP